MQHLAPMITSEELTDLVPRMQYELYHNTVNRELGSPVIHTILSYMEILSNLNNACTYHMPNSRSAIFAGKYFGMTCHTTAFCQKERIQFESTHD